LGIRPEVGNKESEMATGDSGTPASELTKICTVIGRSLAFLCLQNSEAKNGTVLEKAEFLTALGLPFGDAAKMLGSTAESLRVLSYNKEKKGKKAKGATRGKKASVPRPRIFLDTEL
jgi:hypothetical protein